MTTPAERLRQAIAALEQRSPLTDDLVNEVLLAVRVQLEKFESQGDSTPDSNAPRLITALVVNLTVANSKFVPKVMAHGFNIVAEVVRLFGGKVRLMRGIFLIAVFDALPDDPVRASHAALEIRARLGAFAEEVEAAGEGALTFRVGLNTGILAPTANGSAPNNEAMDIAGIISKSAPSNSILISQQMHAYLTNEFEMQPHAQVEVGGRPVGTHQLVAAQQAPAIRQQSPALKKLFVGRAEEINVMLRQIEQLGGGHGSVTVVAGEPGLGKSRLIEEVKRAAPMIEWLQGRCQPTTVALAYGAWNDLLCSLIGAHILEPAAVISKKLKHWLDEHDLDDCFSVFAAQLGLKMGDDLAPEHTSNQIADAWKGALAALIRQRPAAIVLDEAHLMDSLSMALFEAVIENPAETPVLWILLTQPFYGQLGAKMLTRQSQRLGDLFLYLGLEPISDEEAQALVRGSLGVRQLPATFEETFIDRTHGNPLWITQSLRALVDRRGLMRDVRGEWQVATTSMRERQADSMQAIISSRINALPGDARELLQLAAVAGDVLLPGILESFPAPNRQELAKLLRTLDFLDDELHFSNPGLCVAVYQQIPPTTRAELHRHVAAHISKKCELSGPWQTLRAYHLAQGQQVQGAMRAYSEAKVWMYSQGALAEVSELITAMLALINEKDTPEQYARLLVEQQDILAQLEADPERCIALLKQAYDLWMQIDNIAEAAGTLLSAASYHIGTPRELECYREAQTLLERVNPRHEMLPSVYLRQALYAVNNGRDAESKELFQRARTLALQLQDVDALANIHFEMGMNLYSNRQIAGALPAFQQALSYFGQVEVTAPDQRILTCNYLADLYNHMGRPAEGEYYAFEAASEVQRGSEMVRVLPYITLSECYALQGRWQDALHAVNNAPGEYAPADMPPRFWLGRWQFELGDRLDGLEVMREALPEDNLECVMIFVDYLLEANFTEEARIALHRLIRQDRLKNIATSFPLKGFTDRLRGRMCAADRDFDRALSLIDRSIREFEREGFVYLGISTRRIAAQILVDRANAGDEQIARNIIDQCLTKCRSLSVHAETSRLQQLQKRIQR